MLTSRPLAAQTALAATSATHEKGSIITRSLFVLRAVEQKTSRLKDGEPEICFLDACCARNSSRLLKMHNPYCPCVECCRTSPSRNESFTMKALRFRRASTWHRSTSSPLKGVWLKLVNFWMRKCTEFKHLKASSPSGTSRSEWPRRLCDVGPTCWRLVAAGRQHACRGRSASCSSLQFSPLTHKCCRDAGPTIFALAISEC